MKKKNYTSIRLLLLMLPLTFVSLTTSAEEYYRIWTKNEGVIQKKGSEIDSVKVEGANINFYQGSAVVYTNTTANLDSITIADGIYAGNLLSKIGWIATTNSNDTQWQLGSGPQAVLDGINEDNSYWHNEISNEVEEPIWLKIDMRNEKRIGSIIFDMRYNIVTLDIQVSLDDITYTPLGEITAGEEGTPSFKSTFQLETLTPARYIKVLPISKSVTYGDWRCGIWEIDVTGEENSTINLVQFDKYIWDASSNSNESTYGYGGGPYAVIDDIHSGSSYWHNEISNEVEEAIWLKIDMKSEKQISSIIFDMRYNIVTFTVYVSSDDNTYMPLGNFTAGAEGVESKLDAYLLDTLIPARYIKLVLISKSVTYNDWRCGIWEIDVIGVE